MLTYKLTDFFGLYIPYMYRFLGILYTVVPILFLLSGASRQNSQSEEDTARGVRATIPQEVRVRILRGEVQTSPHEPTP